MDRDELQAATQQAAEAFGTELDPLAEFAPVWESLDFDPFEMFIVDDLESDDPAGRTVKAYRRSFRFWSEFMESEGRHPACPSEAHIRRFIKHCQTERDNGGRTIEGRLIHLSRAFRYWRRENWTPLTPKHTDPFESVKAKANLENDEPLPPPRLTEEQLRERVRATKHVRDRAIVMTQLKLGIRASEVANLEIPEVNISKGDLRESYPEMGTNSHVSERSNAVYIPSDRDGNKSKVARIMPLDEELAQVLLEYLLIRPESESDKLFITSNAHGKMRRNDINRAWDAGFGEFEGSEEYRSITSHYGRHRFSTWWKKEKEINAEYIKYMRGDVTVESKRKDILDTYVHTYFEDIESFYSRQIYKLL